MFISAESSPRLRDSVGSLPDFPDRGPQGAFEVRDEVVVPSVVRYELLYGANKSQSPRQTFAA